MSLFTLNLLKTFALALSNYKLHKKYDYQKNSNVYWYFRAKYLKSRSLRILSVLKAKSKPLFLRSFYSNVNFI